MQDNKIRGSSRENVPVSSFRLTLNVLSSGLVATLTKISYSSKEVAILSQKSPNISSLELVRSLEDHEKKQEVDFDLLFCLM
jgi:hypothetical protein